MTELSRLFTPIRIGSMEVKNRLVYAPTGVMFENQDSTFSELDYDFYENLARGGVGMIIVGITAIDLAGRAGINVPGIWDDKFISGWKKLADLVHAHGTRLVPQLHHAGRQTTSMVGTIVAPSAIPCPMCKEMPKELTIDEIEGLEEKYAEAARRAKEAGCDAVEFHGAHGYLVAQFMSPYSNRRTDKYGGSLEGRLRFAVETIKRIKNRVGKDYPVTFRISGDEMVSGGINVEEACVIAAIIADAGADAISVSRGCYETLSWVVPSHSTPLMLNVPETAAIKKVVKVPVITAGRIPDPQTAEEIIKAGKTDLVALARPLMADPEWPNKAAAGNFDDINPCIYCNHCLDVTLAQMPAACTVNPAMGKTKEMGIVRAAKAKNVLVVGGGPAGLEAARVCALRGHKVTLCEKSDKVGGQFNLAAIPPSKQDHAKLIQYLTAQVSKAGVKVELGKEVTPELVDKLKPDAVIVATGATPLIPDIPGVKGEKVDTANDVLVGKVPLFHFDANIPAFLGNNVVVVGGGMIGSETADHARERGAAKVVVVEMLPDIALDAAIFDKPFIVERLTKGKVQIITGAQVKEILDDGIVYTKDGRDETLSGMDNIILAMGTEPVDKLSGSIKGKVAEVHVIGDAKQARKAAEAIAEGFEVGRMV
ncbi:FAD-dependent oxidoreductase [Chloroflexota bacterium]